MLTSPSSTSGAGLAGPRCTTLLPRGGTALAGRVRRGLASTPVSVVSDLEALSPPRRAAHPSTREPGPRQWGLLEGPCSGVVGHCLSLMGSNRCVLDLLNKLLEAFLQTKTFRDSWGPPTRRERAAGVRRACMGHRIIKGRSQAAAAYAL